MATQQQLTKLLQGRVIDSVRQRGNELDIDFEDGSTLSLKLSAPTQSVTLTSEDDKTEYAD
jgi:hypothetical protein